MHAPQLRGLVWVEQELDAARQSDCRVERRIRKCRRESDRRRDGASEVGSAEELPDIPFGPVSERRFIIEGHQRIMVGLSARSLRCHLRIEHATRDDRGSDTPGDRSNRVGEYPPSR